MPHTSPTPPPIPFSQRREFTRELAISFLMQQAVENPGVISLAAGLVDAATLPVEEVRNAVGEMCATPFTGQLALQYGTTPGYAGLRKLLLEHLAQLEGVAVADLGIGADQLLVTTGSQQFLSLVCEALFDPGDICLVAGPTYFVFAGNLAGVGARVITIPSDDDGMRIDLLEQQLQQLEQEGLLPRVKLFYTVSYYDNPGGTCLSTARRAELVELAKRWSRHQRILILEDAAYRELRYDGEAFPSVLSFDVNREYVIYTQTFSKTFSPGVRVGFGVVPADLIEPLCDRKGNEDFGSSNFTQHLIASVLRSGRYHEHLEKVKSGYRAKRDAMVAAAREFFSDIPGVTWREPHGGLYVWMTLPPGMESGFDSPLFRSAVEQGVMYVPGEICHAPGADPHPRNQMRLSFGVQTAAGIKEGMRRLSVAVREVLTTQKNGRASP